LEGQNNYHKLLKEVKRYADEMRDLIKSYEKNPDIDIMVAITEKNLQVDEDYRYSTLMRHGRYSPSLPTNYVMSSVACAVLIAHKGENVLRYLSIHQNNEHLVTLSGPDAETLKESLAARIC